MLSDIQSNFYKNIQRVRELGQLHLTLLNLPGISSSSIYSEDVLRAAVVFLHATLEDLIRGVIKIRLPERGKEEIDKIPLFRISRNNQPVKFSLGDLVGFKDISVRDLITNSVNEYLNFTNYNRVEDVTEFLKDVDIEKNDFETFFPEISSLMKRRHNIVHRADQSIDSLSLNSIDYGTVETWITVINNFGEKIFNKIQ